MAYSATRSLRPAAKRSAVVFDSTDLSFTASGACTIDDPVPGVDTDSGYPGYSRPSGSFITDGWKVGDFIRATGAANGANGSDAAPKVWRIAYLTALTVGVEGIGTSSMVSTVANAAFVLRKVRLFSLANLRSIAGAAHPLALQASIGTNLSGTKLQMSLCDGEKWDDIPKVVLPDVDNGSAEVLHFFTSYESLLMVVPGTGFAGKIYAG